MSPEEETDFQFHLYHCENCHAKLEEMRRLADSLKDIPTTIHINRKKGKIKFLYFYKVGAAIAALFLISYFISFSFRKESTPIYQGLQPHPFHQIDTVRTDTASFTRDSLPTQ